MSDYREPFHTTPWNALAYPSWLVTIWHHRNSGSKSQADAKARAGQPKQLVEGRTNSKSPYNQTAQNTVTAQFSGIHKVF